MAKIDLEDVSLTYPIYGSDARSIKNTVLNFATGGLLERGGKSFSVQAIRNLSLQLRKGDRLALIGHNGAGKSTLLKVLAKIYEPTAGSVTVKGSLNCLFDITMGMDQELNGYENIKMRGLISGLSKSKIHEIIPKVEEFAELGNFMGMPIKTYSTGMRMRLAFGIIVNVFAEILLVDEVVNVGDARFMEKAKLQIKSLVRESEIMVFSSHDVTLIREFCNKALWLEKGVIKCLGPVDDVLTKYAAEAYSG